LRRAGPISGLLFITLFAGGCIAAPPETSNAPQERLLASIRLTESASRGPVDKKHGFFFYVVVPPQGIIGPVLEGREFRDGRLVDEFGGGSGSADVIAAIEKVGLTPFDFDAEVEAITARLLREAQARDEVLVTRGRDGAEWEVIVATSGGELRLRAWNPRDTINQLAPHSENIAKLKRVLDLLSQYYGDLKIGT